MGGSIAVHQECLDIGNRKAFVHTIVDGKCFGDGWDASHRNDGVRHASTIAQEEVLLLRVSTPDYQAAMTAGVGEHGDDPENFPIKNHALGFLDGVGEHELAMLAMMAEVQFGI